MNALLFIYYIFFIAFYPNTRVSCINRIEYELIIF
jgi:hypothetical protein